MICVWVEKEELFVHVDSLDNMKLLLDKLLQSPCSNGNKILPCLYEVNEETWMMSKLSIQELMAFSAKIRVQNSKLTFFIDHCHAPTSFLKSGILNGYFCQQMPSVSYLWHLQYRYNIRGGC
jgi:hypothetical protein